MVHSWSIDMVRFTHVSKILKYNTLKSENYCEGIDHFSGTVICNMVILLQIKKITFEKGENLVKRFTSIRTWLKFQQKMVGILKKVSLVVFLKLPWQIALPNLDYISINTISQI